MICNKANGIGMAPKVFWGPQGPGAACNSTHKTALNQMGDWRGSKTPPTIDRKNGCDANWLTALSRFDTKYCKWKGSYVFSIGEVCINLTSPLMGDPKTQNQSMMKKVCNENYYYADIGNEGFSLQYSRLCVGCFLTPTTRKIWDRQASVCT